jgi:hypothetical protein
VAIHTVHEFARWRDDAVAHDGIGIIEREHQHFAAMFIDMGVGRNWKWQRAVKRLAACCLQRDRVKRIGLSGVIPQRQRAAIEADHVGIGRVLDRTAGQREIKRPHDTGPDGVACGAFRLKAARPDPFVGVARRAVADGEAVHHRVAIKPVVAVFGRELIVGAVAQINAVKIRRQIALNGAQMSIRFAGGWRVQPLQIGIAGRGDPCGGIGRRGCGRDGV